MFVTLRTSVVQFLRIISLLSGTDPCSTQGRRHARAPSAGLVPAARRVAIRQLGPQCALDAHGPLCSVSALALAAVGTMLVVYCGRGLTRCSRQIRRRSRSVRGVKLTSNIGDKRQPRQGVGQLECHICYLPARLQLIDRVLSVEVGTGTRVHNADAKQSAAP